MIIFYIRVFHRSDSMTYWLGVWFTLVDRSTHLILSNLSYPSSDYKGCWRKCIWVQISSSCWHICRVRSVSGMYSFLQQYGRKPKCDHAADTAAIWIGIKWTSDWNLIRSTSNNVITLAPHSDIDVSAKSETSFSIHHYCDHLHVSYLCTWFQDRVATLC